MMNLEPDQSKGASRVSRLLRRLVVAACLVALAATALLSLYVFWPWEDVNAQLRAIDAAHALPDEENAGTDYTLLILNGVGALPDLQLPAQNVQTATLAQPWRSTDFPQVDRWIKEHDAVIHAFLQAGRKPKCWFPVYEEFRQQSRR